MSSSLVLVILLAYFALLLYISAVTSRKATNDSYFRAGRSAHWFLVAFGMVGTSLSGVTFISVPGTVGTEHFYYFQVVMGYFIGYFVVAFVLLPLYYKLNLTSIYHYLQHRLGMFAYKTGAGLFIISRTLGATLRLYLVINVLQAFVLKPLGFSPHLFGFDISFHVAAIIIMLMILAYTYQGGVKTIVWTDTLQTFFMLLALLVCVVYIMSELHLTPATAWTTMSDAGYTNIFNGHWQEKSFWIKHIIGGAFITITMTGMDQEMMQKNISVRSLKDSKKNMVTFSFILVAVNFIFLVLGGMLYLYAQSKGLDVVKDDLFPTVAMQYLPPVIGIIFIIGLISALFPSADGAITALTASFCIDLLGMQRNGAVDESQKMKTRKRVHLAFAIVFLVMVFLFKWMDNKQIIGILLTIAGYTYGPLLGLFAFGILTKRKLQDFAAPLICIYAPAITWLLDYLAPTMLGGYKFGFELLLLNGVITFGGLWLFSKQKTEMINSPNHE
ncbi:MAG: sodium:solute symporter [Flavobacteriales bacterium]